MIGMTISTTINKQQSLVSKTENLLCVPCQLASDAAPSQPVRRPNARQSALGSARPTQDSALRPIRTAISELCVQNKSMEGPGNAFCC
jgi:hypothetical protein